MHEWCLGHILPSQVPSSYVKHVSIAKHCPSWKDFMEGVWRGPPTTSTPATCILPRMVILDDYPARATLYRELPARATLLSKGGNIGLARRAVSSSRLACRSVPVLGWLASSNSTPDRPGPLACSPCSIAEMRPNASGLWSFCRRVNVLGK